MSGAATIPEFGAGAPVLAETFKTRLSDDDGRSRRRKVNHEAMLSTTRALMAVGIFQPTIAEIAERSGYCVRSIFQHFGCIEALRLEAIGDDDTGHAMLANLGVDFDALTFAIEPEGVSRMLRALVLGRPA